MSVRASVAVSICEGMKRWRKEEIMNERKKEGGIWTSLSNNWMLLLLLYHFKHFIIIFIIYCDHD